MSRRLLIVLATVALTACGGGAANNGAPATTSAPTPETQATTAPAPTAPRPTEAAPTVAAPTDVPPTVSGATPDEADAMPPPAVEPTGEPEIAVPPKPTPEPTAAPRFDPATIMVALEPVVSGLRAPLAVTHTGDGSGRLFVVEKGGTIRIVQESALLPTPFLDISDKVSGASEQGLLGLAIEPGRPDRFYVNYTDRAGDTVVARYHTRADDPNAADPASEEVLLTLAQPAANHNGGHLLFGPDGYLWIGMGDGGAAGDTFGNGQNRATALGAMLRLDVSGESGYTVPSDNPFADGEAGDRRIWAIGLRNPWRYAFDRATGELWIADVGQNQWEEVNRVPGDQPGLNFGWPLMEGDHCYSAAPDCSAEGLVRPVTEYGHDEGCSITGGTVYRGRKFPSLWGGYFFGDFCSGLLWAIPADSEPLTPPTLVLRSDLPLSSFGEDEAGEVYVTAFDGTLYRLTAR